MLASAASVHLWVYQRWNIDFYLWRRLRWGDQFQDEEKMKCLVMMIHWENYGVQFEQCVLSMSLSCNRLWNCFYREHVLDWANKEKRTLETAIQQDGDVHENPAVFTSKCESQTLNTTCWQMVFIMSTSHQPPTNIWMNSCRESERCRLWERYVRL